MAEHLRWFVGNLNPSITEDLIYSDGTAVDLTTPAATVKFQMRPVGSATLTVDQSATLVTPATGSVRYDWQTADMDTGGWYLVWWRVTVTAGGKTQDYNEALIEIAEHEPGTDAYLEPEELKSTLEIDASHADKDIKIAIMVASRVVDDLTQSQFYTTASDEVRYYTPDSSHLLYTDEINAFTELATGPGDNTFGTVWTANTDYVLEPLNATVGVVQLRPWDRIRAVNGSSFPRAPRTVRVTGKFGWATVPEPAKSATTIIATKILRRARSAPMGIITAFDGTALRMSRFDPQLDEILSPINRSTPYL